MRRFLAWLCSFCLVFSVTCGVVFGAELSEDDGIMTLSDVTNPSWRIRLSGFAGYGTEEDDGDDWTGVPVLDTVTYPVLSGANPGSGTLSAAKPSGNRPSLANPYLPCSILPYWVGRPRVVSGDPAITVYTSVGFSSGQIILDVVDWEEVPSCSSLQIIDAGFNISWQYLRFDDVAGSRVDPFWVDRMSTDMVTSVHLIINGKDVGEIPCEKVNSRVSQTFTTRVSIPDALMEFDSQLVRSVSFAFNVSASYQRDAVDASGGYGIRLLTASGGNVSDTLRLYSGVAQGEENTGLLKSIIQFLQNIVAGITQLPGKIVTAIIDGLKALFIPSGDDLAAMKDQYNTMLSEKLGFVWQAVTWLTDFANSVLGEMKSGGEYTFQFPGITWQEYVIVPAQPVSLDNAAIDVLRPVAGIGVSLVAVLAFLHTAEMMAIAFISGASYFQWLKGGGGDDS